jgi:hypothetical protein
MSQMREWMRIAEVSMPAFHGTENRFRAFKSERIGTGYDTNLGATGFLGKGFYFTPSERKAADFGRRVIPVMLDMANPLVIGRGTQWDNIYEAVAEIAGREVTNRAEFQHILHQAGYDGIVKRDFWYPELDEYVVFDPHQITIRKKTKPMHEAEERHLYTRDELERMDIDQLDRMAFGVASGDVVVLSPNQIKIKYPDDLENPAYRYGKEGMHWVLSVDFSEPVDVSINDRGEYELEDGHHRWFAARKLGKKLHARVEVKANTINYILAHQAERMGK